MANSMLDSLLKGNKKGVQGLTGKKKVKKIPRTAQESVPYIEAYDNGVLQVEPGVFTKSFKFGDISFKTKSQEEQDRIYENYMKFLNSFTPKADVFLSMVSMADSGEEKANSIISPLKGDDLDVYRKEMSKMIVDKMKSSNNNIKTAKYITISIESPSVDEAMEKLGELEDSFSTEFKRFTKQSLEPIDLAERLEVLYTIMNGDSPNFWFEHDTTGKVSIDYGRMARQGLATKDIICPEVLKFNGNMFDIGENRVGQTMYLDNIANWLNSNFFTELSAMPFEGVVTMHIQSIPQDDAIKMVHNQSVNINAELAQKQSKNMQEGYGEGFISTDLRNAKEQIENLQEDLLNRDQKMFYMSINIMHFATDKDELRSQSNMLKSIGSKYNCSIKPMLMQQERGFTSALPIGVDKSYMKRLMTTESLGVFIPFDEINQFDKGGFYYGINAINKSLVVYNRKKGQNFNGLVLGSSGSGKSFSAKREMVSAILNTDDDIYIIDPDGEYSIVAEAFGGSIIKIAPGNGVYINPFDLDIDTSHDSDSNPITMKADFVCGMIETMLGPNAHLSPTQKSIVGRCIQRIYRPYLEHLNELPPDENGRKKTIDREFCPTMQNLFDELLSQTNPEAQQLALIMESYTTGMFNTFARRTNVDLSNRIVVYDIKDIGSNMMELALKVCMNDVWTKMMENRRRNKWTWFYIDEFHLLLANASTSEFLKTVWKRARKWNGIPTGITQNVEDLLASTEARAIINNSSFVYMMNQSAMDRNMLGELLNLTEADKEFITNVEPGCGLIHTGRQSIPFIDRFPANTELYKIMSTSADSDAA